MTTTQFSIELPELLNTHLEHLKASAISLDVIKERGYTTAMGKKVLKDAGFSPAQQRAPGILIPLYSPDGSSLGFQYRPDHPRTGANERIIKYENPSGSSVHLDVPPRCRAQLSDPAVDIWFTEGVKKVDALTTAGACAVGLNGVWGFKGRNLLGGTTVLADFDYISLKGRQCYLVFDSDLSTNPKVRQALERLAEHLSRKGAVCHLIFLPGGLDGEKVGADDYLSQGHTLEDLKKLEAAPHNTTTKARSRNSTQYDIVDGILVWVKRTSDGESEIPLCNFNARVVEDITRDNGLELSRYFKIEGSLPGNQLLPQIETMASGFNNLNWVTSEWGMKAIIAAGQSAKDRLREAIQLQSRDARQRTIYTHTGWRDIDGEVYFLAGNGAIGRDDIDVELDPSLQRYQLTNPDADPVDAIKKSFDFHLVTIPEVAIPLWATVYLAPLSEIIDTSFTLWLVGATGSFKSTITALAIGHFGNFDSRHLPASWRDTQNTLERLLFTCKDLPLVIDDWAPGQDSVKARELEVKAEYVVRAQGNRQGRQRMRADTSVRAGYIPRGILITSGEQLPGGHSHTARIFSIEIERDDVDTIALSTAQNEQYYYCVAMSNYIEWIKSRYQDIKESLPRRWREYRDRAQKGQTHPRMPEVIASFYCAIELVTEFAQEYKAITQAESMALREQSWDIFCKLAAKQSGRIENERPATRALEIWRAMIDTGKAVLWSKEDEAPRVPVPGQRVIGWLDNSNGATAVLLDPKAAHGALIEYGSRFGQPFTIKEEALWKDFVRLDLIERKDSHYTVPSRIYGSLKRIIKLKKPETLYGKSGNSGNSDDF